eukprot:CAMPEP_0202045726 /NCGR_PEP_ID=MMETSP0963-20130614/892_1 /ASSEMBLY_ACC=CAM_ASM_000494 /TAXON_ID=4773 /ORGANISM="Schizochytrium aggregatum, Strain ATCC28209" /LENGTH=513 /DNA_ID=CAMNT_0048610341 /DNA_START=99 /DNA_END=1641 /DNA_ORIENTATION=-
MADDQDRAAAEAQAGETTPAGDEPAASDGAAEAQAADAVASSTPDATAGDGFNEADVREEEGQEQEQEQEQDLNEADATDVDNLAKRKREVDADADAALGTEKRAALAEDENADAPTVTANGAADPEQAADLAEQEDPQQQEANSKRKRSIDETLGGDKRHAVDPNGEEEEQGTTSAPADSVTDVSATAVADEETKDLTAADEGDQADAAAASAAPTATESKEGIDGPPAAGGASIFAKLASSNGASPFATVSSGASPFASVGTGASPFATVSSGASPFAAFAGSTNAFANVASSMSPSTFGNAASGGSNGSGDAEDSNGGTAGDGATANTAGAGQSTIFGGDNANDDEDGSNAETFTGEESERIVLKTRAKLYRLSVEEVKAEEGASEASTTTKRSWKEMGMGTVHINVPQVNLSEESAAAEEAPALRPRIVMRRESVLKLLLNATIWSKFPVKKASEKDILITCISTNDDGKTDMTPSSYLLKFTRADSAEELFQAICKAATASIDRVACA